MSTHFFGDTAVLLGRSMRHIARSVDTIITTAITPIALMLLFVYVFGGAINSGSGNYVDYLLPGIMLIAIAGGTFAFWFNVPWLVWAFAGLVIVGAIVGGILAKLGYGVRGPRWSAKAHD